MRYYEPKEIEMSTKIIKRINQKLYSSRDGRASMTAI